MNMASRSTGLEFRILTINVFSFTNPKNGSTNVNELAKILKPLHLDLLCMQEAIDTTDLSSLQEQLSLPYKIFAPSFSNTQGNAAISKYPFQSHVNTFTTYHAIGGRRSVLEFRLDGDHPFLKNRLFAVTHLDHLDENDRVAQIKSFNLDTRGISVLIGDMNSLTRSDYTDSYYEKAVYQRRKQVGWELPQFLVTDILKYELGYEDIFQMLNPNLKDSKVVTCEYGTRIDYIFFRRLEEDNWSPKTSSIIDVKGATDHQGVLAVFQDNQWRSNVVVSKTKKPSK